MNFTPLGILASVVFGIWGVALFRRGKSAGDMINMVIGGALIAFPLFVENTGWMWAVGAALCLASYRFGNS